MLAEPAADGVTRLRVWMPGAPGVVLRLAEGRLLGIDPQPDLAPVCDPACPDSLLTAEARLAQRNLISFITRAFGAGSPLVQSPEIFRHAAIARFSEASRGSKLLDLGCGDPGQLDRWLEVTSNVTGLDVLPHPDTRRGVHYATLGPDGSFPFSDAEFDIACGLFVIEHVLDLQLFLGETSRVLRPSGHLLLATTHRPAGANGTEILNLGHFREFTSVPRSGPRWLVTVEELLRYLAQAGLQALSTSGSRVARDRPTTLEWFDLRPGIPSEAEQLWIEVRKGAAHEPA